MKACIRHLPTACLINAPLIVFVVTKFNTAYTPVAQDSLLYLSASGFILLLSLGATTWACSMIHAAMYPESESKQTMRKEYIFRTSTIHYQGV